MKTIKFNPKETEWIPLDGHVKTIVAHFNDGHEETMSLLEFVTINKRKKNKIVQIDCFTKKAKK